MQRPPRTWEDVDDLTRAHVVLRVPLWGRGRVLRGWALVDPGDGPIVLRHRWFLDSYGYAVANVVVDGDRRMMFMHRLLVTPPANLITDHRNRDKLDNRRANLRAVTHAQNMMNVGPNRGSSSAYRGVSWHSQRRKWVASFRGRYLGIFDREIDAARCAARARANTSPSGGASRHGSHQR